MINTAKPDDPLMSQPISSNPAGLRTNNIASIHSILTSILLNISLSRPHYLNYNLTIFVLAQENLDSAQNYYLFHILMVI